MKDDVTLPDRLKHSYALLTWMLPERFRNDPHILRILRLYLKLGGRRLAHQNIALLKLRGRDPLIPFQENTKPKPDAAGEIHAGG